MSGTISGTPGETIRDSVASEARGVHQGVTL